MEAPELPPNTDLPRPSQLEALVLATFALLGFAGGSRSLGDNSTFVHLRTGIDMVHRWSIPRVDPYSFTAHGQPWVVQSWLASFVYGVAYVVGGIHLLVLFNGLLFGVLALLVAILARTGSGVRTMASAGAAVGLGIVYWSPRPLIFGLLGLALVILIVERNAHPLWVIPVIWVWANTHGSFPFAYLWLGLRVVGEMIDTRSLRRQRWPVVAAGVAALVVSAVNPLGLKLLEFPLSVGQKQAAFKHVIEWASPNFQTRDGVFTLIALALAVLFITRARLAWADALPVAVFLVLGLFSSRNLTPFALVVAPAIGRSMRPSGVLKVAETGDHPRESSRFSRAFAVALLGLAAVFAAISLTGPGFEFSTYPTAAEHWMELHGLLDGVNHRVVSQDVVGCYLILLHGTHGRVFIDDRVDMYPLAVSADYLALLRAQPSSPDILNRYSADVVLWQKGLGLDTLLRARPDWSIVYEDKGWIVFTHLS